MSAVIYRPYKRQDLKAVSSTINIIWKYESYYSPKTTVMLLEAYLRLCLTEQTFTQVTLVDGKPIGVITGNHIRRHRCPLVLRLQAGWLVLVLSMTAEGRRLRRFSEEIDRIYVAPPSGQPQEYKGELSFLAIHSDYHGQGIGRELFSRFCMRMERGNIQHFYVFTDTSCNYGFYENMNMFRRGTKRVELKVNHRLEEFSFFLYENGQHQQFITNQLLYTILKRKVN